MKPKNLKETIINFWNREPCGTFGKIPDNINLDYFLKIRKRRYKLEFFIKDVVQFNKWQGQKVLEVGCGVGIDGLEFAKNKAIYTGVDVSQESLELAKTYFALSNQRGYFLLADSEKLPFKDNSFDLVYSWGVLHFAPNIQKAISEIYRVVKPGGHIIVMLYNRRSLVGLQLYILYGLLRFKPFISVQKLFSEHHQSKGTKAFSNQEIRLMFNKFTNLSVRNFLTPYDFRISKNIYLPRWCRKIVPSRFGLFTVIKATKPK